MPCTSGFGLYLEVHGEFISWVISPLLGVINYGYKSPNRCYEL